MNSVSNMKEIKLTKYKGKSYSAFVDDEDYERVNQYRWQTKIELHTCYARSEKTTGGRTVHILMHRFILGLLPGDKRLVDHRDSNGLNNCKSNLRLATTQENVRHGRKHRDALQSIYKGVYWEGERNKWRAYIYIDKKKIWLGRFIDEITAAKAYNKKALELFGEYAAINNID